MPSNKLKLTSDKWKEDLVFFNANHFQIMFGFMLICIALFWASLGPRNTKSFRQPTPYSPPQNFQPTAGPQPSLPYVDLGGYPYAGVQYGYEWALRNQAEIKQNYSLKSPVAFRVAKGEKVQGLTGALVTKTFGLAVAQKSGVIQGWVKGAAKSLPVSKGSKVFVLHDIGKGQVRIWLNGEVADAFLSDDLFPQISEPKWEWWVQIRNKAGKTGWSNETDKFCFLTRYDELETTQPGNPGHPPLVNVSPPAQKPSSFDPVRPEGGGSNDVVQRPTIPAPVDYSPTEWGFIEAPSGLTLRETPSRTGKRIALVLFGSKVRILDKTGPTETVENRSGNWFKVEFRGAVGWAFGGMIVAGMGETSVPPSNLVNHSSTLIRMDKISDAQSNVRSGPDVDYPVIDVPRPGTEIAIFEIRGKWLRISYKNIDGWVNQINLKDSNKERTVREKPKVTKKNPENPKRKNAVRPNPEPQKVQVLPQEQNKPEPAKPIEKVVPPSQPRKPKISSELQDMFNKANGASKRIY